MTVLTAFSPTVLAWVAASDLDRFFAEFAQSLADHGYSRSTQQKYLHSVAHFARWMVRCRLIAPEIDAAAIGHLVDFLRQRDATTPAQDRTSAHARPAQEGLPPCAPASGCSPASDAPRRLSQAVVPDRGRYGRVYAAELPPIPHREWRPGLSAVGGVDPLASPAAWRLAPLPEPLSDDEVQRLLAATRSVPGRPPLTRSPPTCARSGRPRFAGESSCDMSRPSRAAHPGESPCVHLPGKGRKERSVPVWATTATAVRRWVKLNAQLAADSPLLPSRAGPAMTRANVAQPRHHCAREPHR